MIDNSRIKTGYDVEILLGADYLLAFHQSAYDSGELPSEVQLINGWMLHFSRPSSAQIRDDLPGYANFEITVPVELVVNGTVVMSQNVVLGIQVNITPIPSSHREDGVSGLEISFNYVYLDEATRTVIRNLETTTGIPGILVGVEDQLRQNFQREIEANLLSENVSVNVDSRLVSGADGYQNAFGLYLNISNRVIVATWPRGNLNQRLSFLPQNRSFAIGFGKDTFKRFEDTMWHNLPEEEIIIPENVRNLGFFDGEEVVFIKPVKDGDEPIGSFTSLTVSLKDGFIKVVVKMEIWVDWWPDADVTAVFHYTPRTVNGNIELEPKLASLDVDTGLLGDLLGFLIGAVIGGLLGGPLGAGIGGVGGVVTIEITEEVLEGKFDDQVEAESQDRGLEMAFNTFPPRVRVFADQRDPFFTRHYDIVNYIDEVKVDNKGMSYAGHAVIDPVNEPNEVMIIDKARGTGTQSWNGLISLTYRTRSAGDIVLTIHEVLQRLPLRQLAQVRLVPTHIHRTNTVVSDILFDSGLDLHVAESIALQGVGALRVMGYQLISDYRQRNGKIVNAHYRARADGRVENNFESLPRF